MVGHFPTGADLVQAAVEFSEKLKERNPNLEVLYYDPGHLPALLWAKAVQTHFGKEDKANPEVKSLLVRIGYALEDAFKCTYDGQKVALGVIHATVFGGELQDSKDTVRRILDQVNDESKTANDLENPGAAFVGGRYYSKISGSSHAIVKFNISFGSAEKQHTVLFERLEIETTNHHRLVEGSVHSINPTQVILSTIQSMMTAQIGRSVSNSIEWMPIVMLFKLFGVVNPDKLKPPLSSLSHFEFHMDLASTGIDKEQLEVMKSYLEKCSDYNFTRISNISNASKRILELYFTHLPGSTGSAHSSLPDRTRHLPPASTPRAHQTTSFSNVGATPRNHVASLSQFNVVRRVKASSESSHTSAKSDRSEAQAPLLSRSLNPSLSSRSPLPQFGGVSYLPRQAQHVQSADEEQHFHFPTGRDLVTAAVGFSEALRAHDETLEVLYDGNGHLPSLLWARALENAFDQEKGKHLIGLRSILKERLSFQYSHFGEPLTDGVVRASIFGDRRSSEALVSKVLIHALNAERNGSTEVKLFYSIRIGENYEVRVRFAISYHHGTRQGLLFPTTRLNVQAAPILTINPAQIVLNALRSMMLSRVGSNVDLSPAWHPIILFWKMLKDIKVENLEDPFSALSPQRFKTDLSHLDTSYDDLMAMKEYLTSQTEYKNNKISYMRDASKYLLEKYFAVLPTHFPSPQHLVQALSIRPAATVLNPTSPPSTPRGPTTLPHRPGSSAGDHRWKPY